MEPQQTGRSASRLIAEARSEITGFGPYVAAIGDDGFVVYTAETRTGTAVFESSPSSETRCVVSSGDEIERITSHPVRDSSGRVSFYADVGGCSCLVRCQGAPEVLDGSATRSVGPLGPSLSDAGDIAYRVSIGGSPAVAEFSGAPKTVSGDWSEFEGIPVHDGDAIVFRTSSDSRQVIVRGESVIAETGEAFTELARFPSARDGVIAFAASAPTGQGIYAAKASSIEQVVPGSEFESFRGAVLASPPRLYFFATPIGGSLGVYRWDGREHSRVTGLGDAFGDSVVSDLALNHVSVNRAGTAVIRLRLASGRELIAASD